MALATDNILNVVRDRLSSLFNQVGEQDIHGLVHANRVCEHARRALDEIKYEWCLHTHQQMAVLLAALLHDADDPKVFSSSDSSLPNARQILTEIEFPLISDVLEMINLVSFSKNGN